MKVYIVPILVSVAFSSNFHLRDSSTCYTTVDCPTNAPCCRDSNGQAIVPLQGSIGLGKCISQSTGTCSNVLGKDGDICDYSCDCESGYKCYRPMSGVCCPPMRCYNATWVEQQEHYWANCQAPRCQLPHGSSIHKFQAVPLPEDIQEKEAQYQFHEQDD